MLEDEETKDKRPKSKDVNLMWLSVLGIEQLESNGRLTLSYSTAFLSKD